MYICMYMTYYFMEVYIQCIHMYINTVFYNRCMYIFVIPVAPSVTEAIATLVTPNENKIEHTITVTCTVRPESDADMCVVMARADGRTIRKGT